MAVENITLNLIPTGDTPSIHVAQFDVDRPFNITLKEGEDDFTPTGYDIELQVRKVDSTIVTVVPLLTTGNVVTFGTTEQMTACSGTNLAELQLTKDSQTFATLHFYLVVQRDVLAGGVTSESDIYNLTEQIAAIVPEVVGEDYYNKEEVDEKIAEIPTFDPTNYYDKSDVNTLLNDKADVSDLPDMNNYYDKSETDALLDDKANVSDLPDMTDYYTKSEVDTKITDLYQIKTASGGIVHITDGGDNIPVKSFKSEIVASETGSGPKSPSNPYTISGFSQCDTRVEDDNQQGNTYTITFGQTVYGGRLIYANGQWSVKSELALWTLGTKTDFLYDGSNKYVIYQPTGITTVTGANGDCLCEALQFKNSLGDYFGYYHIANNIVVMVPQSYTITDFNNEIAGTKLVYPLVTPVIIPITSDTRVKTILGENNIFSNCGDIEVEYFTEKSDGIAELIKAFM